jgi:hypothetical protein
MSEFKLTPEQVVLLNRVKKRAVSKSQPKAMIVGPFVMLPVQETMELAAALNKPEMAVLVYVAYRSRHPRYRGNGVVVPNQPFLEAGFSKDAKRRGVERLEQAGLIRVYRDPNHPRRSPRVVPIGVLSPTSGQPAPL